MVKGFLTAIKEKENQIKNVKKEDYGSVFPEETADAVAATAEGYVHAVEQLIASSYMLGMIHADEEKPRKDKSFTAADEAQEEIPAITFEKAKEFLASKIPLTKSEWLKLEPKLRFRAFTVAKLGQAELIDRVKWELVRSLEEGTGYAETWNNIRELAENSIGDFNPWYWETVFRTNTQSAYVAGKLQQYEGTGAKAYQLMVIDDSRTTDICRNLLRQSGYGMVLPVEHDFWKKYGFPPYHFNCRTSVRAVYSSQIGGRSGQKLDNIKMSGFENFKPQEGFGGNPVDNGNWWKLSEELKKRSEKLGVKKEIEQAEKKAENELIQGDFIQDIKADDKDIFYEDYKKISDNAKLFIDKYGQKMHMKCYEKTNGYFSPYDNTLHFNLLKKSKESMDVGFNNNMVTFLHEFGHWLDYNALDVPLREKMPNLKKLLKQDALEYVNQFSSDIAVKTFDRNSVKEKNLMKKISMNISEKASTNSSVSDIFEGITNGKVVDGYGHGKNYWKRPKAVEKEAIAEMFEAMACGGKREAAMRKYFPSAFGYFESIMKDLL
ncbi:MAG: phage minor head protein [Candidatus Treponema excrementipullorum]|nr:phage minor head protein [Candidatus Treponema excrementipullorum]